MNQLTTWSVKGAFFHHQQHRCKLSSSLQGHMMQLWICMMQIRFTPRQVTLLHDFLQMQHNKSSQQVGARQHSQWDWTLCCPAQFYRDQTCVRLTLWTSA